MDINKWLEEFRANEQKIADKDSKAKAEGKLVGRYINEPYADGKAVYVITKEFKTKVEIEVCTGIGDDWVIPYWGTKTKIDKSYALTNIQWRDNVEKLFRKEGVTK